VSVRETGHPVCRILPSQNMYTEHDDRGNVVYCCRYDERQLLHGVCVDGRWGRPPRQYFISHGVCYDFEFQPVSYAPALGSSQWLVVAGYCSVSFKCARKRRHEFAFPTNETPARPLDVWRVVLRKLYAVILPVKEYRVVLMYQQWRRHFQQRMLAALGSALGSWSDMVNCVAEFLPYEHWLHVSHCLYLACGACQSRLRVRIRGDDDYPQGCKC